MLLIILTLLFIQSTLHYWWVMSGIKTLKNSVDYLDSLINFDSYSLKEINRKLNLIHLQLQEDELNKIAQFNSPEYRTLPLYDSEELKVLMEQQGAKEGSERIKKNDSE